jgi:hypothetical protein
VLLAAAPLYWLSGMRFGPQHAHAASLLRAIDLLDAELSDLQEQATAHLAAIPGPLGVDAGGVTVAGLAADAAALPAAERLDEIPGLGRGKKGHGNTYAKRIAVLAAYAAANTATFLGERFRRLSSRPPAAAGARKPAAPLAGPS